MPRVSCWPGARASPGRESGNRPGIVVARWAFLPSILSRGADTRGAVNHVSPRTKGPDTGVKATWVQIPALLAARLGASHGTSLGLRFLICEMGVTKTAWTRGMCQRAGKKQSPGL